jgi:four helix bundle protein
MASSIPEDLSQRSFEFSCDAYDYCEDLVKLRGLAARVGYQLFDAASSVGANRSESKSSYSEREFAAKNAICLKEAREALFWLRIAENKKLGDASRRRYLLQESNQLVSIYVTVVRNLQDKLRG